MKKIHVLSILLVLFWITGCSSESTSSDTQEKSVTIQGNLTNSEGKELILMRFENNQPVILDTISLDEKGQFELSVFVPQTDFYRLAVTPQNGAVLILSPGEDVKLSGNAQNMNTELTVSGSGHTEKLFEFYSKSREYGDKNQEIRQKISQLSNEQAEEKQALVEDFNSINAAYKAYSKSFIEQNSGSPAVLSALGSFDIRQDLEVFEMARKGLEDSFSYSNYYQDLEKTILQQRDKLAIEQRLQKGNTVPNIVQNNPEGEEMELYDLKGKVVLIDFWASWCKPCRAENPNVVRLYKKYKNDGFEIYSVSLDKSKDKWVQAIAADGLEWPYHVSDLKFWNAAPAKEYNVSSIPYTVLVDKDSRVIDTKLRGASLENKLKELFGH
jgi:thiol-disulfide isomerase/thioredoxin